MTRPLSAEAQETLEAVQEMQPMTRAQLIDWLGLKPDAASRRLQALRAKGLIVSSCLGPLTAWSVAPAKTEGKT